MDNAVCAELTRVSVFSHRANGLPGSSQVAVVTEDRLRALHSLGVRESYIPRQLPPPGPYAITSCY